MAYSEELIAGKLRRWEKYILRFRLPEWEEIPNIGLYMDQVVMLLMGYLDYMPPELKEEQVVTAAAELTGHPGEFPYVAAADGAARAEQDEP